MTRRETRRDEYERIITILHRPVFLIQNHVQNKKKIKKKKNEKNRFEEKEKKKNKNE